MVTRFKHKSISCSCVAEIEVCLIYVLGWS